MEAIETKIRDALAVLNRASAEFGGRRVYAMFSGGHDSLAATAVTAHHPLFAGAVHINTGIGIEKTRQFVRDTCAREGWPLIEVGPPEKYAHLFENTQTYEDLVLDRGFPGPANHPLMYNRLKERGIRAFLRQLREAGAVAKDERVVLSTGIRLAESVRRFRTYSEPQAGGYMREGNKVWASPIQTWEKADCLDVIEHLGLERNEVVDILHMSGECLCGAFASEGEIQELETWFPEVAAYLHELEARVEAAGRIGCVWGRRPDDVHKDQMRLLPVLPLCSSCEARAAT